MIPVEFKEYRQWVSWLPVEREGKITKIPITRENKTASTTNPDTWDRWENIESCETQGFVFTKDDPFTFIDLDDCIDENGNLEPWAEEIVDLLDSYTEISPSKRGLHIFCKGSLKKPGNRKSNIEIYETGRYSTITGDIYPGCKDTIEDREEQVDRLHKKLFKKEYEEKPTPVASATELSDDTVLEKLFTEKNGEKWKRVFHGDTSDYGGDDSRADLALITKLTFYTQDRGQLGNLFRMSGLYRKKFERDDYRNGLLDTALGSVGEIYTPPKEKVEEVEEYKHPAIYTVDRIVQMDIVRPKFMITDIITDGLNLIIGKVKAGKSALIRQAGLGMVMGGKVFGDFIAEQSEVLYLNLEETLGMFQTKINKILINGVDPPKGYHVATREQAHMWGKIGDGFLERVVDYLDKYPDIRVLSIDTYSRIKPKTGKQSDGGYMAETRIVGDLMLLLNYLDAIVLSHHSKKGKEDDWVDDVLGSTGLAAAADTIVRVFRDRGSTDAQIDVTGKAIAENTFKAEFIPVSESWEIFGTCKDWTFLTTERKQIYAVFQTVENAMMKPSDVAQKLGKGTKTVSNIMNKMKKQEQLESPKFGKYKVPSKMYREWIEDHPDPIHFLEKFPCTSHGDSLEGRELIESLLTGEGKCGK